MQFRQVRTTTRWHWRRPGGYRELLTIAAPLVLSTASWTIQHFVDRMFLTWYSQEAMAAVLPSGILSFALLSLFIGTASYVSTFVAQYHGAGRNEQIGAILWQGMYVAAAAGMLYMGLIPLSGPIFRLVGHDPTVRVHEVVYFRVLCYGAFPAIACSAMSGFYSGRGKTWPVMWVNVLATVVNTFLNYVLIFGHWGFPEMGVRGAALGTVASQYVSCLVYLLLLSQRSHDETYRTFGARRLRPRLLGRLLKFGLPNGLQFFIDIAGFAFFVLLVGRLGKVPLAATNIAFNINMLAFMPMIGIGITVSVLVGKYQGMRKPDLASRSVWSGFVLCEAYMASIAAAYVLLPGLFLAPYAKNADPVTFAPVRELTVVLLRFVAFYSIFDTLNIIFAAGIKGAGDTRFVVFMVGIVSVICLVLPSYVFLNLLGCGIYTAWVIVTVYVVVLGASFLWRFLAGAWRSMRVIEGHPPSLPSTFAEVLTPESEL